MTEPIRLTLKKPERTGPIRSRTAHPAAGTPIPEANARPPGDASQAGARGDPGRDGVHLGYRLLEEQMRQYQQYAEQVGSPSGGESRPPPGPDFRQGAESVLRFYEGIFRMWASAFSGLYGFPFGGAGGFGPGAAAGGAGGGFGAPGSGFGTPGGGFGSAPAQGGETSVSIEILGMRNVRTSLQLHPGPQNRTLRVQQLVGDAKTTPLTGVEFAAALPDSQIVVRITVPEGQSSGSYHGVVLDAATDSPCGTLTVVVGQ